jgi:hypothetical protein
MQHRDFNLKIKSVGDAGTFTGLGAAYNNTDLGGDVILPGAFARTLSPGKSFPLLWQHDPTNPIGSVKITDSREGLKVDGTLLLTDPVAMKAYNLMKAGIVKGLSIGYDVVKESFDGDTRQLVELRLWELSIVTFPMNELATVSGVKAMSQDEITRHVKNLVVHYKAAGQHLQSMRMSLKALLGDDDDLDDQEDDLPADDPALLEANDDDSDPADEGMSKAFLVELQKLAEQARELATA